MLSKLKSAKMVARWFVQQGILEQFNTAKEIQAGRLAIYALPGAGLLDVRLPVGQRKQWFKRQTK